MSAARTLSIEATEAVAYCGADPNQVGLTKYSCGISYNSNFEFPNIFPNKTEFF